MGSADAVRPNPGVWRACAGSIPVPPSAPVPRAGRTGAKDCPALWRRVRPHGQIVAHGPFQPRFLVETATINHLAGGAFARFEFPPPVLGLPPAGQGVAELVAILHDQIHALAARVPEQVQVGGEMHVGFQHVGVHFDFKRRQRRAAFFANTALPAAAMRALICWSSSSSSSATLSRRI